MRIAVLSGKGGAGKTMTAVNLAFAAGESSYIDCDVEEPNGRLFFKPEQLRETEVCTSLPTFDADACTGCRKCVDFCRFNALVYLKNKPKLFDEVCHSCGGCQLVCPANAISETRHRVGVLQEGRSGTVRVVTGVLDMGESSGVPVIKAALAAAGDGGTVIIDCPPGSACPVVESISDADFCLLVAEPTAFGFDNFCMVHELASILGKPCGVVINKMEQPYGPLEAYCGEHQLPVLLRIPYDPRLAKQAARGEIVSKTDPALAQQFRCLLTEIGGRLQ